VTAVGDLSFDVPRNGIFVLLGSNGAGKSTTLSILGGLLGRSSGDVVFYNGHGKHGQQAGRPTRGDVGIVPQKNVLFEELTCLQNLRVFAAVKAPAIAARKRAGQEEDEQEDLVQLLRDCDLEKKINEKAGTLSGGQKRKLQLAAGLVGGSSSELIHL
jgi:ATP-binding cassette subfamily A (ABC1) protein 3